MIYHATAEVVRLDLLNSVQTKIHIHGHWEHWKINIPQSPMSVNVQMYINLWLRRKNKLWYGDHVPWAFIFQCSSMSVNVDQGRWGALEEKHLHGHWGALEEKRSTMLYEVVTLALGFLTVPLQWFSTFHFFQRSSMLLYLSSNVSLHNLKCINVFHCPFQCFIFFPISHNAHSMFFISSNVHQCFSMFPPTFLSII